MADNIENETKDTHKNETNKEEIEVKQENEREETDDDEEKEVDDEEEREEDDGGQALDYEEEKKDFMRSFEQVTVAEVPPIEEVFCPANYPPSYKETTSKEDKAVKICKTFMKQYTFLLNRRRPLLLIPRNEFGIKKVVCTTIKPLQLPFKDLLDWPDIAEFVAGYINYDKLKDPLNIPDKLCAPQTVLERLHGHCFEYSTLLCSMLIGAGYDAFVVSGYATREVANLDLSYTMCPFVEGDQKAHLPPSELNIRRYTVRPPRLFTSEYVLRMQKKDMGIKKQMAHEKAEIEQKQKELREAPPEDPYYGWRVHSWVMVLAGLRDVKTTFFIEPTTGIERATDWKEYLGIESLWNHRNYYVNMQQEKIEDVGNLNYDIGDSRLWEYVFKGQDLHVTLTPEEEMKKNATEDLCLEEMDFTLPESWTLPLKISRDDFDRRYPTGKRTRKYKNAIVVDYCRYINADGLVRKIYVYSDLKWKDLSYTREIFEDRADLLASRFIYQETGKVIDDFDDGREDFLKCHHYILDEREPEKYNVFHFDSGKRADELYKREEDKECIKSFYGERDDKMTFFSVQFGPKGIAMEKLATLESRLIQEMLEKHDRNPLIAIEEDMAEVSYLIWCDQINIIYQVKDDFIASSKRNFSKPVDWYDESSLLEWNEELHENFEIDVFAKSKTELQQYQMMLDLMAREAKLRNNVRLVEIETKQLLKNRDDEEKDLILLKNYNQADRDADLKEVRKYQKAQEKAARILAKSDTLKDYLEPFIMALNLDKVSNRKQAQRVKDECMQDLKERLVFQVNLIRSEFNQELELIEKTQAWYHAKFVNLTRLDLADFRTFMVQHMFTAHILERRLLALKESASVKYHALYDKLRQDPRLEPYLF